MNVLSLFSGIGGIDYAFEAAGFRIIEQVEIDDYCTQVLTKHWPQVPKHRDIFDYHGQPGAADVIAAGFPCQPFSTAGKRLGQADERFLWPQLVRVIAEVRPLVVFLENVPGLRTNDGGRTFKHILWQLAEIGYDAEWGHLQAAHVGAPHKRERVFVVAYGSSAGLAQREGIGGDTQSELSTVERSGGAMAYAAGTRLEKWQQPAGWANGAESERGLESQPERRGETMAHTFEQRRTVGTSRQTRPAFRHQQRISQAAQCQRHNQQSRSAVSGAGTIEPGLGRSTDGLSERLVGHRFPAGQGAFQYDFEAPRTAQGVEARTAKIRALGNAVVPQCVYPVALAIREWMETI